MATRLGRQTILLENTPSVCGFAAVASKAEAQGPMAPYFDLISEDTHFGEKTWEKAESRMQKDAANKALEKAALPPTAVEFLFAGDLLNQCIGSTYGLREFGIPLFGVYGACSTMAESLTLAALFVEAGLAQHTLAVTSSHFCSAERQFRFPLEYGGQRPPTAQWTVTGAGAAVVGPCQTAPFLRAVTPGCIVDLGINDQNNMGAAMAPAAADTLCRFFADTGTAAEDYDLILTGDLGTVGTRLLCELLAREEHHIEKRHADCGLLIYDRHAQDVGAGGSGCGCSASVLCSYVMQRLQAGTLQDVLFLATGALMSTVSIQQGETIPGIAHLVHLSAHTGSTPKGGR